MESKKSEKYLFSQRFLLALSNAGLSSSVTKIYKLLKTKYPSLKISSHAIRKWTEGESIPTQDNLILLAKLLCVEPNWLRFGNNENEDLKVKSEIDLLRYYRNLTEEQKIYTLEILKRLSMSNLFE
jgi:hypothetical protein